jgi:hypothetical protein
MNETVTLSQAKNIIRALAADESVLLLSSPGLGKSDIVRNAAAEAGLECRSLLGTQIAPEDVSGVPKIDGERSVFCPPRILLPEDDKPFCLFLDELPAAGPDVQKAFYALLLERRIGEFNLPKGTWVVAAGNRAEDRALVRTISSALVNRVLILHVRVDNEEWISWARANTIRSEIIAFISAVPDALMRSAPPEPVPFSTPRAWASLSASLDLAESAGLPLEQTRRALAYGKVSAGDASLFCGLAESGMEDLKSASAYIRDPSLLPAEPARKWFIIRMIRKLAAEGGLSGFSPDEIETFLSSLPGEIRFSLLVGLVNIWGDLGASDSLLSSLREATGLR